MMKSPTGIQIAHALKSLMTSITDEKDDMLNFGRSNLQVSHVKFGANYDKKESLFILKNSQSHIANFHR